MDIWVRIVRLWHPRNATNARTLFVIRQKYDKVLFLTVFYLFFKNRSVSHLRTGRS